jgi:hypothetical protein
MTKRYRVETLGNAAEMGAETGSPGDFERVGGRLPPPIVLVMR